MRKTDDKVILSMLNEGKQQKDIATHFGVTPAAICKRLKRLLPKPKTFEGLTAKKQKFVLERVRGATKTNAALAAFDCSSRESAKTIGIELSNENDIQIAMQEMLQQVGLTRRYRAIKTKDHVDNPDPNVSLKALDQANKIDGSYTQEVHIHNIDHAEITKNIKELLEIAKERGLDTPEVIEADVVDQKKD